MPTLHPAINPTPEKAIASSASKSILGTSNCGTEQAELVHGAARGELGSCWLEQTTKIMVIAL